MADTVYEGLFILDSNRYARDPGGISGGVNALIEKYGGEVLVSRLWDERRLAYPIKGHKKGTYWLTYFRIDGEKIAPMTEESQRTDNFLRHLFLKVDPRIVDTLVSHAQERKDGKPAEDSADSGSEADADKPSGDAEKTETQPDAQPEEATAS